MKVLMVGPDRDVHGGISAVVNNYYKAGLDQKVGLKYIGTMKEGSKPKKLVVALFAYIRFAFVLSKYDIVHVNASSDNSFWRKSYFIRLAKKRGKKVILHQHGGDFKNYYANELNDKRRKKIRVILNMTDSMIVLSDSWKEYFGKLTNADKIHVLPNSVFVPKEIGEKSDDTRFHILFLGRICKEKGIVELLSVADKLQAKYPDFMLNLGGIFEDPGLRKEVESRSGYVSYLGWVSDDEKEKYFNECGVLALPSYFEGFGLALIEAMAHRCAVIGSSIGGIPEIIDNGNTGLLVKPRSAESLYDALCRLFEDETLFRQLSHNGYEEVKTRFSIEDNVDRLVHIYELLFKIP